MFIEDFQWIGIFPSDRMRKARDAREIKGKWLCFGPKAELHRHKDQMNALVERGSLRAVNIAQKDPRFDPFPHKECVMCVYTSDDETEKLHVKVQLTSMGLNPSTWKSEAQTYEDWGPNGKLAEEAKAVLRRRSEANSSAVSAHGLLPVAPSAPAMGHPARRHKVFVSYSHSDERWRNRVAEQLGVLSRHGRLDLWDDKRLRAGDDWFERIHAEMSNAKVALLLVSASFLNSDFICREEVPKLFARHAADGLRLIPILVRQCPWQAVPWLSRLQMRPSGGKPLAGLTGPKADDALTNIAHEVAELCEQANAPGA